ncbi:3-oxo-tetronate kinase [Pelagibius sp.]|uniref:3-oxo-tetronate kinase n=1 Tax=Pelagibius sp. TaxID=1931238 RepID=UPI00260B006D|nr:3-oxo-tetronate kinase [Pelagibius sp.]
MLLGCIADDLTGATDLALMLVRGGMRTVQVVGVPQRAADLPAADAVVVALKSRTTPPEEAVAESLASAEALLAGGAKQLFFKYCSTFDSTDKGNIGPVTEALMARLDCPFTLACPAFPGNQRAVFQGHLFVGTTLLSDSPLKDHPLTPMRDPNLVSVLSRQTHRKVGLVPFETVEAGAEAIAAGFERARDEGVEIAIVDAISDSHLVAIGRAAAGLSLITGGSGVAMGLPQNFRDRGLLGGEDPLRNFAAPAGPAAILSGSCSAATQEQVAMAEEAGIPAYRVDALSLSSGETSAAALLDWAGRQDSSRPLMIYSTAAPETIRGVQDRLGRDQAGALVEETLAEVARGLVDQGVRRLIVAGGETSGAVVNGLSLQALEIGPEIDPGVPWTRSAGEPPLALALKSGNFGAPDFFLKAWDLLP